MAVSLSFARCGMDDPVDDVPGWWIATSCVIALVLIALTLLMVWGTN